jgi:hypothetical protein
MIEEIKDVLKEREFKEIMNLPQGRYFVIEAGNLYITEEGYISVCKNKYTKFIMHISKFKEMYD